jgi:hypothetical protein
MVSVNGVNMDRLDERCKMPYRKIGWMDVGAHLATVVAHYFAY